MGAGFLTGKYKRDASGNVTVGGGRLDSNNQPFRMFTERNWKILETLGAVSLELGKPMSEVALAWALAQPGITSLIFGATTLEQLHSNLSCLEIQFSAGQMDLLQQATAFDPANFYSLFQPQINKAIFNGSKVEGWLAGR